MSATNYPPSYPIFSWLDSIKDFPENTDDEVIDSESGFSEDGGPDWPLRDSPKKPDIEPEAAPSTCQLDTEHP